MASEGGINFSSGYTELLPHQSSARSPVGSVGNMDGTEVLQTSNSVKPWYITVRQENYSGPSYDHNLGAYRLGRTTTKFNWPRLIAAFNDSFLGTMLHACGKKIQSAFASASIAYSRIGSHPGWDDDEIDGTQRGSITISLSLSRSSSFDSVDSYEADDDPDLVQSPSVQRHDGIDRYVKYTGKDPASHEKQSPAVTSTDIIQEREAMDLIDRALSHENHLKE